jgi:hypothetical protein
MAQVAEYLPSKCQAIRSNSSTGKEGRKGGRELTKTISNTKHQRPTGGV